MSGMSQTLVLSKNIGHPRKIHWLIITCSLFQTRHNWVIWNILSIFGPTHTNIVYIYDSSHDIAIKRHFHISHSNPPKNTIQPHVFFKKNAHFVQDSSSKVFASEWKKCSRSPAIIAIRKASPMVAPTLPFDSQIKAGYNRNMVYRIAVLPSVF